MLVRHHPHDSELILNNPGNRENDPDITDVVFTQQCLNSQGWGYGNRAIVTARGSDSVPPGLKRGGGGWLDSF